MTRLTHYQESIARLTGCPPARAAEVEDLMRCQYGTLDHLDRRTFAADARLCWTAVQERDAHIARGIAACQQADEGIGYCPICGRETIATMKPFRLVDPKGGAR